MVRTKHDYLVGIMFTLTYFAVTGSGFGRPGGIPPSNVPKRATEKPAWEVMRGPQAAWRLNSSSLSCAAQEEGEYWVISSSSIDGNWLLNANLHLAQSAKKQGLLFGVQPGGGAGYLLSLGERVALWKFQGDQFTAVADWPLPTEGEESHVALKVLKTGATYAFWVNGALVNTISNPSWERTPTGMTPGQEPDGGRYGFALAQKGEITNLRVRPIRLAKKYAQNPVLPPQGPKGSYEESQAFTAGVLRDGETFYLYYTGIDAADPKQEGGGFGRLGVATSDDLMHWTKYEKNPLLGPGPAGAWDGHHLQFGPLTKGPNGRYVVSYQAWDDKVHRWHGLGVAFSPSPLGPFEKYHDNPVLRISPDPAQFDAEHTHLHTIVRKDDGTYVLLYTGFSSTYTGGRVGDQGGVATSRDLIHWEKYSGNPVFRLNQAGAWDDGHVRPKGAAYFKGWYYMFYEGAHYDGKTWFDQVGMARSKDLIHWERFPFNPIIPLDTASGLDTLVTEWPCAIVKDNKLYVLYWGGKPGAVAISLAEIPTEVLAAWDKQ